MSAFEEPHFQSQFIDNNLSSSPLQVQEFFAQRESFPSFAVPDASKSIDSMHEEEESQPHQQHKEITLKKIKKPRAKRTPKQKKEKGMCNCKNNECGNKYCQCFAKGRQCGKLCGCSNCTRYTYGKLVKLQVGFNCTYDLKYGIICRK